MSTISWTAIGIGGALVAYAVFAFNRLVLYRNEVRNSFSQMDVQMKRRCDLIPNLVETVRGVMKFEKETLESIVKARASALGATAIADRAEAESRITGLVGRLLAVWESYPELKSGRNALALQDELASTENRIAYARGHYNDVVANYNTLTEQFPSGLVARTFGFRAREFFRAEAAARRLAKVSLQ